MPELAPIEQPMPLLPKQNGRSDSTPPRPAPRKKPPTETGARRPGSEPEQPNRIDDYA
jgi:hypothetical protein